jgi:D-serine deaminase-like pyridoxal phosphate-dependent protein
VYKRQRGTAVVNAGSLALSRDPGPVHADPHCGFGVVLDLAGVPLQGVKVLSLTQEHGVLGGEAAARLKPGELVRIVPNHACLAAALFERYHAVRGGEVEAQWWNARGW